MVESASQVTPKSSQIENGLPETPEQNQVILTVRSRSDLVKIYKEKKISMKNFQKKLMESSSQVTPGLSQLETRDPETPEQLQVLSIIQTRSD